MKAIALFEDLEKGILQSIKAAEVYTHHLGSIYADRQSDESLIRDIITDRAMSGIRVLSICYTAAEKKELTEKGQLINIGSQILLATYTALESYLTQKFKEYALFNLKGDADLSSKIFDRLPSRTLDQIKTLYKDILGIHLPLFEINFMVDPDSTFKPGTTWKGIKIIERARHEIAHEGRSKGYKIRFLPDVWDPFDFVRRWVNLFDGNFDALIYEGRSTSLIEEYRHSLAKQI